MNRLKLATLTVLAAVNGYFMITLGWDFPYARLFAVISGYLLYTLYTAERDILILRDAVNHNARLALESADLMDRAAEVLKQLEEEIKGSDGAE